MARLSLKINRIINATCQEVFAAWSRPELMAQWLFPLRSGWTATASNNFEVGGEYKQVMIAADGTTYSHTGIYKEIIPDQKIVFTWNSDNVKDTLVTVELRPQNDKTEITLIHELLPNEKQREEHQTGWQECLHNLEKFFANESYHCYLTLQAPVEQVYQALTEAAGLKNWWTQDCAIDAAKVGAQATFRFGLTNKTMQIKELIPNNKIIWQCIEHSCPDQNLTKTDEWIGTEIIFQLIEHSNSSTDLYFIHQGLTPALECFDICQKGWNYYLKESLKTYLETGVGKPYS